MMAVLLWMALIGRAQGQPGVTVSIFNEATALPFSKLISTPVHPGIQAGTEFTWKESDHFRLYPTVQIGYMFHRHLFQGLYLNAELGLDYKTSFGLNIKSRLGIGYLHTFTTQQEYQLKNTSYTSNRDLGNPRIMPSLSLGLGYPLFPKESRSPEIFAMYQTWIEYPYSPGFIPLMSHTNLHLGATFYPFPKHPQP
jgi:hypothetical protein